MSHSHKRSRQEEELRVPSGNSHRYAHPLITGRRYHIDDVDGDSFRGTFARINSTFLSMRLEKKSKYYPQT